MTKVDIVDKDRRRIIQNKSNVELSVEIEDYECLVERISMASQILDRVQGRNVEPLDETKGFSPAVSKDIWLNVITATKPIVPGSSHQEETLSRIYKMLYQYTIKGEYPLLQQLCNYLGVNMEDFFSILATPTHPDREPYMWAYNVFESAAQMNAIRGNGNANARQWIDKSREYKMASEDRVSLAIEGKKIDKLKEIGADIAMELIGGGE